VALVAVTAAFAKTPLTYKASLLLRVVLTIWPDVCLPVRVMVGVISFSRVALA
jgi:hypothetical protein